MAPPGRFKKFRAIFLTIVGIKLILMLTFMYGKTPVFETWVISAFAQDETDKKKAVPETETTAAKDNNKGKENSEAIEEKKETAADSQPAPDPVLVLDGLEEKRKMLLEKEEQLKLEQERLDGFKKEIEEKLEKLSYTYKQIEESLEKLERKETESERVKREAEEAKMTQLVKVFSSMKPKKAGEIINNMDLEVAKKLFLKMKGDRAGEILSFVNSDKAALISEKLTEKKEMF